MKARIAVKIRFGSVFIVRFFELFCDARDSTYMKTEVNSSNTFFRDRRSASRKVRQTVEAKTDGIFLEMVGLINLY